MDSPDKVLAEILERVVRMESRMVQLGDHVGANLRTKQRITITTPRPTESWEAALVEIDSLDVSASRILTELRIAGIKSSEVLVRCNGKLAFTLYQRKGHST